MEGVAVEAKYVPEFRLADASGILKDGLKYRFQFTRRIADDSQHLAGRGLLPTRLSQLPLKSVYSCLGVARGS
jgi:hypothetical protein